MIIATTAISARMSGMARGLMSRSLIDRFLYLGDLEGLAGDFRDRLRVHQILIAEQCLHLAHVHFRNDDRS
jgi:hypothetical protein